MLAENAFAPVHAHSDIINARTKLSDPQNVDEKLTVALTYEMNNLFVLKLRRASLRLVDRSSDMFFSMLYQPTRLPSLSALNVHMTLWRLSCVLVRRFLNRAPSWPGPK